MSSSTSSLSLDGFEALQKATLTAQQVPGSRARGRVEGSRARTGHRWKEVNQKCVLKCKLKIITSGDSMDELCIHVYRKVMQYKYVSHGASAPPTTKR